MNRAQRQLRVLVPLLLVLLASELALNRLAVPALRIPAAGDAEASPPTWHQLLDHAALFIHYFATGIAVAVVVLFAIAFWRDRSRGLALRAGAVGVLVGLAVLTAASLVSAPGEMLTFWFETVFVAALALTAILQLRRGGSVAAKIGVLLLTFPLAIHYYGPLASRTPAGREALWLGLPEQVQALGQWALVMVALATPYLFAPRPAHRALMHPFPALVAVGVAGGAAFLLSYSYEVSSIVASRGIGFDLGPGAETSHLALYVLALASITWTTVACLVAPARARRLIGVGLALLVTSSYALAWPLHYLASAIALLVLTDAARRVVAEENERLAESRRGELPGAAASAPPAPAAAPGAGTAPR